MPVQLDHTIVTARDKHTAAQFLADLLDLQVSAPYGPFVPVETGNGVKLDFLDVDADRITPQHYAFLVTEDDFDAIFARIQARGILYYADPHHERSEQINRNDGGRGLYLTDPNGHSLEVITRPYGSGE